MSKVLDLFPILDLLQYIVDFFKAPRRLKNQKNVVLELGEYVKKLEHRLSYLEDAIYDD